MRPHTLRLIHHLDQAGNALEQGAVLINPDRTAFDRVWAAHGLERVDIFQAVVGDRARAGERLRLDLRKVCRS